MNVENLVLVAAAGLAFACLVVAVLFQHGSRSLRSRLVVTFVALTLVPALLTLVLLWRELAPQRRLRNSEGLQRSTQSGLLLARQLVAARRAAAQAIADSAAARLRQEAEPARPAPRRRVGPLDGLASDPYVVLVFGAGATGPRLDRMHGDWEGAAAQEFLRAALAGWPASPPAPQLLPAPDSTRVVLAVSGPVAPGAPRRPPAAAQRPARAAASGGASTLASGDTSFVLVALPVPAAEAVAILSIIQSVQQTQRLGFLEDLRQATAARLVGGVALFFLVLAIVLGVLLARSLTLPIERLMRAFEAVAGGELGHEVEAEPPGELGRLTAGFNRMSRDLEESKSALVRAARLAAWQDVARRLAHEIKNPLTPITLSIHRIRRRVTPEDGVTQECLDTILEETSHLERLANEFSSFARLPKPDLRAIEPAEVLQQVLDLYSAHPGVRLRARLDGLPRLLADRDQMRQVFTNLVKNAVEAMPEGGELEVLWERAGGRVALTFLDSGTGFAPEALEHLFDPTFTTKPAGSGLGLAIVRRILEDHGGDIAAGNRPEGGAWVRVLLREA